MVPSDGEVDNCQLFYHKQELICFFLKTNRKEIYETFRLQTVNQLPKLNFLELV